MYVGISSRLLMDVRHRIEHMQHVEQRTLGNEMTADYLSPPEWMYRMVWGKNLHLKDVMPKEWKSRHDRVHVRNVKYKEHALQVTTVIASGLEGPPGSGYSMNTDASRIPSVNPDIVADPVMIPVLEQIVAKLEVDTRWNKVQSDVRGYLSECKSLNDGLKHWPDLRLYIPPEYLEKVEQKVERSGRTPSRAAEHLKSMDTDSLTAAVVIARMSEDK